MKSIRRLVAVGAVATTLVLAGCGSSDSEGAKSSDTTEAKTTTTAAMSELEIKDVWARTSPMATTMGAIYMTITSPEDDALIEASVPTSVAKTTEIHETVPAADDEMTSSTAMSETTAMEETTTAMGSETTAMEGGSDSMTMRPVDSIELPAGETVKLEPGGYHVMLIDLVEPLTKGSTVEVTLTFEKAGEKTVTAEVRDA